MILKSMLVRMLLLWGTMCGMPALVHAQYFYTTNAGSITITGFYGPGGNATIPSTINGYPVRNIGTNAFELINVTNVIIPASVTNLAAGAFYECNSLRSLVISNGVTTIGYQAFYEDPIVNLTLPASVATISPGAFQLCTSLATVYFVGNAPAADTTAFASDNGAKIYYFPGTTGWGSTVGGHSVALFPFTFTTNAASITVTGYTGPAGAATLPGTILGFPVTNIGTNAFVATAGLTSLLIPNGVTNIGAGAFFGCPVLNTVTVANTVTNIGAGAFFDCPSLIQLQMNPQNAFLTSAGGALYGPGDSILIRYPDGGTGYYLTYDYATKTTSIGPGAFGYSRLTTIELENIITNIGAGAFLECTNLTAINADAGNPYFSSVNGVLFNAAQTTLLQYPGGLTGSYAIPAGVTNVGGDAFQNCPGLTRVTMPGSVAAIASDAFTNCPNLTSIVFSGNAPTADATVFLGDPNATVYYFPGTTGWSSQFAGLPARLWNPVMQTGGAGLGVRSNQFQFKISGASNLSVVVETCTNLASPSWQAIQTNTLTGGSTSFSDPQWTNYPGRFYRLRSP